VNAFEKRAELVEKWHTDLTKSLDDMYDLAEQVLDVWQEAEKFTEERIIKLLEGLTYTDEQGHEMISEFKTDLIALIKGEQK
jgi:hypothetical protein